MAETYKLVRDIPVEEGWDLVVAGGGPGGAAAAVCAGRLGARVLLLEATGCLGGMGTSGLVTAFDPMADGEKALVGGLMAEICERLYQRGELAPHVTPQFWRKMYHQWTPYRVEGLKRLLDELAAEADVDVRFFTKVIDAQTSGPHVDGVIAHTIEGYQFIRAKAFIDATGDAVLADLCGAACREAGRDAPAPMPPTLCSLASGIDWSVAKNPDKPHSNTAHRQHEKLLVAMADGHFSHGDKHLPGLFHVGDTLGMLNTGHVFGMDALNCRSLSNGMVRGRQLAREYVDFYRKYVPGCENIEHVTTASLMGVRESRRIVGEYELTIDDYRARRQFDDQIGVFNKFVDIHVHDDSEEELARFREEQQHSGRLGPGECFGIPYRILVPKGWENLWVAGRCNSSDVQVHGSIRVMPAAAMMGQAAGTAAVQAIEAMQPGFGIDTGQLIATLRENGAYLPQV
jgi:hypothetical protein